MPTHDIIELACIVVTTLALVAQTIVVIVFTLGTGKAVKAIKGQVENMSAAVMPTVEHTRALIERVSPKIEQTVNDISDVARVAKTQSAAFQEVSNEVLAKVRKETGRIDTMFSGTLDAVDKASTFVASNVSRPLRQLSGILASIKAVIEALGKPERDYSRPVVHDEKDMFV